MEIIEWNDDNTETVMMRVVKVNHRGEIPLKKMYKQQELPEYFMVIRIGDSEFKLVPYKKENDD